MIACHKCNVALDLAEGAKIGVKESCEKCLADLHCCKMCKFYDPNSYNECKEMSADRVVDKEKFNYCDYFLIGDSKNSKDDAKSALDAANALFKD